MQHMMQHMHQREWIDKGIRGNRLTISLLKNLLIFLVDVLKP